MSELRLAAVLLGATTARGEGRWPQQSLGRVSCPSSNARTVLSTLTCQCWVTISVRPYRNVSPEISILSSLIPDAVDSRQTAPDL